MKGIISICILGLLGVTCATKKRSIVNKTYENVNSLLWEISGNGLKQSSYLFGTIHIIGADDYFLENHVVESLQQSSMFVTEVDLANLAGLNPMDMMIPGDSSLSDFMEEAEYEKVKQFYIDQLDIGEKTFEFSFSKMLPMMSQQAVMLKGFGDKTKSYEMELSKIAETNNLETMGLESLQDQIDVFKNIPMDQQISMLMQTVDSLDKATAELNNLVAYYKKQDINGLARLMNTSSSSSDLMENKDALLVNRNSNWIPIIDSLVQTKKSFIAVGAAHLPEQTGVIQLLRDKGYTVKAKLN